jgi:hypothetical protein
MVLNEYVYMDLADSPEDVLSVNIRIGELWNKFFKDKKITNDTTLVFPINLEEAEMALEELAGYISLHKVYNTKNKEHE